MEKITATRKLITSVEINHFCVLLNTFKEEYFEQAECILCADYQILAYILTHSVLSFSI